MDMAKIAGALGLGADAGEDAILAAIGKLKDRPAEAMQSALTELGATFAVEGADPVQIVAAGKAAKANADLVAQLQTENAGLKTQLQTQTAAQKKAASEAWIDGEIAKKRAIPAKDRDFFVTLHMERPDAAVRAVEAIGLLGETHTQKTPVEGGLKAELSAEQLTACTVLGLDPEAFKKTLSAEQKERS